MNFKIVASHEFVKDLKRLAKRYRSIRNDVTVLADVLRENPTAGIPLGNDCYKIRFAITSKGRGKSGGGRLVTCVKIIDETVYFLTIYDKSDQENVADNELSDILKSLGLDE